VLKINNYLRLEESAGFFIVEGSFAALMGSWMYVGPLL